MRRIDCFALLVFILSISAIYRPLPGIFGSVNRMLGLIALLVWAIGVFSLTWEYVPQTWLLFALSVSARYAGAENLHEAPPEMSPDREISFLDRP